MTSPLPHLLSIDIANNHGADVTIDRFFAYWVELPNTQKLDRLILDGTVIWNTSDPDSPSDIPAEGSWRGGANLTIPNTSNLTLLIEFPNALQATGYEIHIVFDIGCQIVRTR